MVGVHSGLHLEDESGEGIVDGAGLVVLVQAGLGGRGEVDEEVEEFVDAEVEHGRGEHHRGRLAGEESLLVVVLVFHLQQIGLIDSGRPGIAFEVGGRLG